MQREMKVILNQKTMLTQQNSSVIGYIYTIVNVPEQVWQQTSYQVARNSSTEV